MFGKSLMECQHVAVGRLLIAGVQPVEQGMCRFMGDDVVGDRTEYARSRQRRSDVGFLRIEIAEQQSQAIPAVIGILLGQRVRIDAQALHILGTQQLSVGLADDVLGPQGAPTERMLEASDGSHRHRIDHLLMELGIGLGRLETVLRQKVRMVEVDGSVAAPACRIDRRLRDTPRPDRVGDPLPNEPRRWPR
jgi:hypothetical protein